MLGKQIQIGLRSNEIGAFHLVSFPKIDDFQMGLVDQIGRFRGDEETAN